MALGDSYITTEELAAYLGVDDSDADLLLDSSTSAATEWVEQYTQRQFNNTQTATARTFVSRDFRTLYVDDFHTSTGLIVATDTTDNGTYDTTWTTADYVLQPWDGVEGGVSGFPYRKIVAVEDLTFPCQTGRPRCQVTAKWGWASVPESVKLASKIVAAYLFNLKDSPFGVASFGDNGLIRLRTDVPQAAMILDRYRNPSTSGPLVA